MANPEVEAIKKKLVEINSIVKDRFDPVTEEVGLLKEEMDRLGRDVVKLQERERSVRRDALISHAGREETAVVDDGPFAGMDVLDLGLLRRFARSQRREPFGPAWLDRAEEAKRSLVSSITPAEIQSSHQSASRKLADWYAVDGRPTGQYGSFSRAVLQSLTRAAMDSTTAGSGDELVATLEARELWLDVNLQTLVAPLVTTFSMPSNPFDIPRQLGDVDFYPGTENIATTSTALSTGKATQTPNCRRTQTTFSATSSTMQTWTRHAANWTLARRWYPIRGARRSGTCRPRTKSIGCRTRRTGWSMSMATGIGGWRTGHIALLRPTLCRRRP